MIPILLGLLLLGAPLDEERGARLTHGLIGSYIVASAMDLSTTQRCLGAGTCREANPLLRPLEDMPLTFAAAKTAVAVGVAIILIKQHTKHPRIVRLIAVSLTAGSLYIAVRNTRR